MNLVYRHEKTLLFIAGVISTIFWVALVIGTLGIALIYLLLLYLFFLFAHSAFISYLRGNGIRIGPDQLSDLNNSLHSCCSKLDIKDVPEAYLIRMNVFNALATRFLGKNYVVLYTDVVDALANNTEALKFYIGHELGHIHRKHLVWSGFLFPASILPLLGAGLRRAEEYTCDRYGAYCCDQEKDVTDAISTISSGDTRWDSVNIESFVGQSREARGFWMSYHELTGDYPWLSKRMAAAIAFKRDQGTEFPKRNIFAWLLAAVTPRFGAGGITSFMITVAIIGILAAVALPQYQNYTMKAKYASGYNAGLYVQELSTAYLIENQTFPTSLVELGLTPSEVGNSSVGYSIDIYDAGIIGIEMGVDNFGEGQYIVLEPIVEEGLVDWVCYGQNVNAAHLPPDCQ